MMNSRIRSTFSIFFLNPNYVSARSLRSQHSNSLHFAYFKTSVPKGREKFEIIEKAGEKAVNDRSEFVRTHLVLDKMCFKALSESRLISFLPRAKRYPVLFTFCFSERHSESSL